ncbi:MAG: hypothetical protein KatS3mg002_0990 [Candidatus Woesearchaeota archaeon]|nr:MAG: hypothetical protein KatS3mg002_0990 [Candidatus Woesearchaeota archaeon]
MNVYDKDNPHPLYNRECELVWKGKYDIYGNKTNFDFSPNNKLKKHEILRKKDNDSNLNFLFFSENRDVLINLKKYVDNIDLIYIDPPYNTGNKFYEKIKMGDKVVSVNSYIDKFKVDEYLQFMYERLFLMHKLLKEIDSIFVHLDWHIGHYVKMLMDEIFGKDNFQNEIIWSYDQGARGKERFARKHDTIFWYSMSKSHHFFAEKILVPYESGMTKWRYTKGLQAGKEMPEGKVPSDVWDIKFNSMTERLYDTEKPYELIEKIVQACSTPSMIVADLFCGSGTTLAVAQKLKRRWIGSDSSISSFKVTRKRMYQYTTNIDTYINEDLLDTILENHYLECSIEAKDNLVFIKIDKFIPKINENVSKKDIDYIKSYFEENPFEYIEFWGIDYNYNGEFFTYDDIIFSDKKKKVLSIVSNKGFPKEKCGIIAIKVVDIFGKETIKILGD